MSTKKISYVKRERQLEELAKLGIHNAEQLKTAMEKLGPLDIGCFTSPFTYDPSIQVPKY
ncbi:MAG: hypothetical protein AB9856_03875 [Cellulosilyticaceae bacterium]